MVEFSGNPGQKWLNDISIFNKEGLYLSLVFVSALYTIKYEVSIQKQTS